MLEGQRPRTVGEATIGEDDDAGDVKTQQKDRIQAIKGLVSKKGPLRSSGECYLLVSVSG